MKRWMALVLSVALALGCSRDHRARRTEAVVTVDAPPSDAPRVRKLVHCLLSGLHGVFISVELRPPRGVVPRRVKGTLVDRALDVVVSGSWQQGRGRRCLRQGTVWYSSRVPGRLEERVDSTITRLVRGCIKDLSSLKAVEEMDDRALIRALAGCTEPSECYPLLDEVIARSLVEATPQLVRIFRTTDSVELKKRLLGVFARLRARGAVDAIIEYARSLSEEEVVPVLAVLAQIGGGKAEAFLVWASSYYRSRKVRNEAARLVERLRKTHRIEPIRVPSATSTLPVPPQMSPRVITGG